MTVEPEFLTVDDVLDIHTRQLERFGGQAGLRDQGLLESALAQPQASFGEIPLHETCSKWQRPMPFMWLEIIRFSMVTNAPR